MKFSDFSFLNGNNNVRVGPGHRPRLECMGREKKRSQNLDFLRLANFFLRLRGAKSQKSFATTPFLRL